MVYHLQQQILANVKLKFVGGIILEEKIHNSYNTILNLINYNVLICSRKLFLQQGKIIYFCDLLIFALVILKCWKLYSEKEMTEHLFCERTERNVLNFTKVKQM